MSLYAKDNQKIFLPLEAGTHAGRICAVTHIGTITDNIKGKDVVRNRMYFTFEIPEALKEDGTPFTVGQEFTLSMNSRGNLLPFLESMLGKKFTVEDSKEYDVQSLIGQTALVNVVHSTPTAEGVVYANIKSVSPLPKSMKCAEKITEPFLFDYDDNFSSQYVFSLHEKSGMYKKISRSEEWLAKGLVRPDSVEELAKDLTEDKDVPPFD